MSGFFDAFIPSSGAKLVATRATELRLAYVGRFFRSVNGHELPSNVFTRLAGQG